MKKITWLALGLQLPPILVGRKDRVPRLPWLAGAMLAVAAFTPNVQAEDIIVKGSDTLLEAGKEWGSAFAAKGHKVTVSGGGSGSGIAALINGTATLAQASRSLKADEEAKLGAGSATAVAKDALCVYLNPGNKVGNLTVEQVGKIYRGEIKDWSEVGGAAGAIVRYQRESSSGTFEFFKEHFLGGAAAAPGSKTVNGADEIAASVAKDANGIGYGADAHKGSAKVVTLNGVSPDAANVKSGKYPGVRDLFVVTKGAPTGHVKQYVDFILSADGQAIAKKSGFYPVK